MKTLKNILFCSLFLFLLCGCGATPQSQNPVTPAVSDSDATGTETVDYSFWEQTNTLRLTHTPPPDEYVKSTPLCVETGPSDTPIPVTKLWKLQDCIIRYFNEVYQIDVSDRFVNQQISVYSDTENSGILGFIDMNDPNIIHLNETLFKTNTSRLNNVYVRECLHQIGFQNPDEYILVQGLTEALADNILLFSSVSSFPSEEFDTFRLLANQLIIVDEDLPRLYLENSYYSLTARFNQRLKELTDQSSINNVGKRLLNDLKLLYLIETETIQVEETPLNYSYDAQEIVRSYCKSFEPNHEQIDSIRRNYLIPKFETIEFTNWDGSGGKIMYKMTN